MHTKYININEKRINSLKVGVLNYFMGSEPSPTRSRDFLNGVGWD